MEQEIKKIIEEHLEKKLGGIANIKVTNLTFNYDVAISSKNGTTNAVSEPKVIARKGVRRRKQKRFRRTGQYLITRNYTTSPEDIKVMRTHIAAWNRAGLVDKYNKSILEPMGKKYATSLTQQDKERVLQVFKTVREKVLRSMGREDAKINEAL